MVQFLQPKCIYIIYVDCTRKNGTKSGKIFLRPRGTRLDHSGPRNHFSKRTRDSKGGSLVW